MSEDELELDVKDELFWDRKVDSAAIAVSADDDGRVTLRGTVASLRQRREAKNAAQRVYGVTGVTDELEVRILNENRRDDADLRGAVLQALMLDSLVPSSIDAKVRDGWVTLTGSTDWQFQRDEAEFVAANVLGVTGVDDEVWLVAVEPTVDEVEHSIKKALKRSAKLDAKSLGVETMNGTVTLSGVVSSWSEHDAAVDAAWAAPGVTSVNDRILVEY
jgi:osmotically-inducible protein OsmY